MIVAGFFDGNAACGDVATVGWYAVLVVVAVLVIVGVRLLAGARRPSR